MVCRFFLSILLNVVLCVFKLGILQNTVKFPQDNSDIVNGKYAMEQEISKVTLSHLCGKPCNLIDKRKCQKVCSKEIGHDDNEHLCQSTIHYCEKNCSLSTHTVKGDYHCP